MEECSLTRTEKLNNVVTKKLDQRLIGDLPGKKDREGNPIKYISGEAMLVLLREAFGPYFSVEYSEPRIVRYDKVNYMDKKDENGNWDNSGKLHPHVYTPQQVVEVKCTLTVPIKDEETGQVIMVKREGFGSASMKKSFEEMILKTAQTDALKKAAYSFGFALELFMKTGGEKDWADAELYGLWTQTAMQEHQNELAFVQNVKQKFGWNNVDEFAAKAFGDPTTRLTPTNITEAVKAFKELIERKKKEKEMKTA